MYIDYEYQYKALIDLLGGTAELRSKKELIEKFFANKLENIQSSEEVIEEFDNFWAAEKDDAASDICEGENLDKLKFESLVDELIHSNRQPLREYIFETMSETTSVT